MLILQLLKLEALRGLRGRVTALVIVSALPALALFSYSAWKQHADLERGAGEELLRIARVEAQKHGQLVEGARQTLVALAPTYRKFYEDGDQAGCHDFSARVVTETHGLYQTIGVSRPDGEIFCNAVAWQGRMDISDRAYFRKARDSGRFAVGEYLVGRATGREAVNFALPLRGDAGNVIAVAFIGLDVAEFDRRAAEAPLRPGAFLAVLDLTGKVLAMQPPNTVMGWIGEPLQDAALRTAVAAGGKPLERTMDREGTAWLVAVEPVIRDADGSVPLRVLIALPHAAIVAGANAAFATSMAMLVLAMLLSLALGWWGAYHFVRTPLSALLDTAGRVQSGDLAARTGLAASRDEIGQLALAFDAMTITLQQRDCEVQALLAQIREQAIHDPLTGLYNRRQMEELLSREFLRARRSGSSVAVLMLDIDHFKAINDTWGHETGDRVLRQIAATFGNTIRGSDIACRYGGEEFLLVLPGMSLDLARQRAEQLRARVKSLELKQDDTPIGQITISIGVAAYPDNATDIESLLRAADAAMYEAKNAGRNRVVAASSEPVAA